MLGFLAAHYPDVSIALHAGELTLGLVPPEHLRSHIRQAVQIARAKRIGHGVALSYEDDALSLLADMRQRGVLVEICLTSNDVILGVKDAMHPLPDYWQAGVPVTLATDDEGVSRIDLSHEYWRAATTYGLGYRNLKSLARNSLTYSFLAGASLWQSLTPLRVVDACVNDPPGSAVPSATCQAFLQANDRARLQWRLEQEFVTFERLPWLQ
jgi:adenosine deaminase/adenosine deaminase CECR1